MGPAKIVHTLGSDVLFMESFVRIPSVISLTCLGMDVV